MSQIDFARRLRRDMTPAERLLWGALRARRLGFKFRRQTPIGLYVADLACVEARLVVEIDGGQHLDSTSDKARDAWLGGQGWRVARYWNQEVLRQLDGVVSDIRRQLTEK